MAQKKGANIRHETHILSNIRFTQKELGAEVLGLDGLSVSKGQFPNSSEHEVLGDFVRESVNTDEKETGFAHSVMYKESLISIICNNLHMHRHINCAIYRVPLLSLKTPEPQLTVVEPSLVHRKSRSIFLDLCRHYKGCIDVLEISGKDRERFPGFLVNLSSIIPLKILYNSASDRISEDTILQKNVWDLVLCPR